MTLTIPDVEQWNPSQLTAAAAAAGKLSTDLDQAVAKGYTDTQKLRTDKSWTGGSADIAENRMNTEKTRSSAVSQALVELQTALGQQVTNLENAKKAVLDARDAALHPSTEDGAEPGPFEVADNGVVTAVKRKSYWSGLPGLHDNEIQSHHLDEDGKAATHQTTVTNALKQAELIAESATTAVDTAKGKVDTAYTGLGDPNIGAVTAPPASTAPAAVPVAAAPISRPAPSHTATNVSYNAGSNGSHNGGSGFGYHGGTGLTGTDFGALGSGSSGADSPSVPVSGDVKDWIAQAKQILIQMGYPPDAIDEDALAIIIQHESGGDPSIVNGWDSNAAAGHPSVGLMQTIDSTFNSYAVDGHHQIKNPVDNILAASRYAIDRYGSLGNVPGVVAVRHGGAYVGY
ncbi:transglycosylase SLT domain-containing protein [Nocardia sp. NPDC051570]|uniref:transglycosylase SLT domain-containing protein n=1 Tax=Nocardia sp. NPDC051570 TaxID=3364324 RepID=UPI0037B0433E